MDWNANRNNTMGNGMTQGNRDSIGYEEPQITVIGKGTKITGTMSVAGDLVIEGEIEGDISCQNTLKINGLVNGNIETADLQLDDARIHGNVNCAGEFILNDTSVVDGDCHSATMVCGGRIKGNVDVDESACFQERAALVGDLDAGDIEIIKGAVIQGKINIRQDVFFDDEQKGIR